MTAPIACIKIVGYKLDKPGKYLIIIFVIAALYSLVGNIYFRRPIIVTSTLILRLSGLVLVYFLLFKNRKKIQIIEMKAFYNSMLISAAVLIFVLFLVISFRFIDLSVYTLIKELPLDQLFVIILSSLISIFLSRFFFLKDLSSEDHDKLDQINLTDREKEIANLILNGYTSKEAAKLLSISQQTVKNHTSNIYKKLKINSKIELFQLINGS